MVAEMKLCFVSDLHIDIAGQPKIVWPEADALFVAGDTSDGRIETRALIEEVARIYPRVFFVDGNHDNYSNGAETVADTVAFFRDLSIGNATFLGGEDEAIPFDDLYVVGRNGWYSFDSMGDPIRNREEWKTATNDCDAIGFDRVAQKQPWELAREHADEIRAMIERTIEADAGARFAVMTHSAPHIDMIYNDPKYMFSNPFYVNMHMAPILARYGSRIAVWQHGHTHNRRERIINGAYVIANPRGRLSENPSWEPVVIDI